MLNKKRYFAPFIFLSMTLFTGCAPIWQQIKPGDSKAQLIAKLGPPKEVYTLKKGQFRLLWPTQPMGNTTIAADINPNNKITDIKQVLQPIEFYKEKINQSTRADVLVHFGRPLSVSYFPLMQKEVWTYRYLESNVWHMLYNFYFDKNGILTETQKTPDPMYEPSLRNLL